MSPLNSGWSSSHLFNKVCISETLVENIEKSQDWSDQNHTSEGFKITNDKNF